MPKRRASNSPEYFVEAILDARVFPGGQQRFLIKWLDYADSDCTWEPLENLQNVLPFVDIFLSPENAMRPVQVFSEDDIRVKQALEDAGEVLLKASLPKKERKSRERSRDSSPVPCKRVKTSLSMRTIFSPVKDDQLVNLASPPKREPMTFGKPWDDADPLCIWETPEKASECPANSTEAYLSPKNPFILSCLSPGSPRSTPHFAGALSMIKEDSGLMSLVSSPQVPGQEEEELILITDLQDTDVNYVESPTPGSTPLAVISLVKVANGYELNFAAPGTDGVQNTIRLTDSNGKILALKLGL